jgi:hypothetical protein
MMDDDAQATVPQNSHGTRRCAAQEKKMKYEKLENEDIASQSNVRAEDGLQESSRWTALCEDVLIPLGSLFAVFMVMLGVMLIAD